MSSRFLVTVGLFLTGGLHTMIFSIFQIPGNFLLGNHSDDLLFACKVVLYLCAITVSLNHQIICRKLGLRRSLYVGLVFNVLGISSLWFCQALDLKGFFWPFLGVFFFGISLTSVINPLITYIVLEFPKRIGAGITGLFAVFNAGVMSGPLVLDAFRKIFHELTIYPFLILILFISIWFIHQFFFDPPYPKHLEPLRKESKIWSELHYRLGLFVIAIICYGLTETTFSLWGVVEMRDLLGPTIGDALVAIFWLFMVIGQLLLLIPLYLFPAKRIFYILIFIVMIALYRFPEHKNAEGFIADLAIAGIGCSAIFPILISMMEKELIPFAKGSKILPYIETATSVMVGGYFVGVGIVDLWVVKMGKEPWQPSYFYIAMAFILATGLIGLFLNLTVSKSSVLPR